MINHVFSERFLLLPTRNPNQLWRMVKLTSFLLLCCCLHVSAISFSQTVTLNVNNQPLTQVLASIEQQTGYFVMYNDRFVAPNMLVSVDVNHQPLEKVLNQLLHPRQLTYLIEGNTVAIRPNNATSPLINSSLNRTVKQQHTVSGRVTDEDDKPLEGVTVRVKGTNTVTTTNSDGRYEIHIAEGGTALTYTLIGFEQGESTIANQTIIDFSLTEAISSLDEVVVIGFGERRKKDLTGSVSTVGTADIGRIAQASPQFALQGQATGVRVVNTSGNPNEGPQIFVRGVGTWNGSSQPLYVVDGQVFEPPRAGNEDEISAGSLATPPNIFNLINPNDIESISVLKDASAAAVYGSRAANGVVLITTKRGQSERPTIEFDANTGIQSMPTFDMLNTEQYIQLSREMYMNSLNPDIQIERNLYGRHEPNDMVRLTNFNPQFDPESPYYISDRTTYNWQDELVDQNAFNQNHSVRVSGATNRVDYYVSAGYFDQHGGINSNKLTRYTGAINLNVKATDWAKVGVNYKYTSQFSSNYGGNIQAIAIAPPWQPIYDPSHPTGYETVIDPFRFGTTWQGIKKYGQGSISNLKALSEFNTPHFDLDRNFGQFYLELTPLKGLMLRGSLNLDYTKQDRWGIDQFPITNYFLPTGIDPVTRYPNAPNSRGFFEHRINNTLNYQTDFTASYNRTFANKHNLDLLIGVQDQRHRREIISLSSSNLTFVNPNIKYQGFDTDQLNNGAFYGWHQRFWFGMVGRASYNYDSKYYLDVSMRRDASNGFDREYRWGNFYALAGAWRISSEPFFNWDLIDDLKLHGGWGQAGNDEAAVGRYAFLSRVQGALTTYRWGSGDGDAIGIMNLGGVVADFPNPNLSWEVASTVNLGLDALLLNDRLNITAEWYKRITSGILQTVSLPLSVGTSNPLFNIGELENKGVDVLAGWRDNLDGFSYGISGNISFVRNMVSKLYQGQPLLIAGLHRRHTSNIVRIEEGRSAGAIWGYKFGGIFQTQQEIDDYYARTPDNNVTNVNFVAPGDMYFLDVHGDPTEDEPFYSTTPDGRINDFDRTEIGDVLPGYTYGLNLNVGWKGVDLILNFYGEGDVDRVNSARMQLESMGGVHNQLATTLNRWTPENPNTSMPRAVVGDPAGNNRLSDRWVEDASFFRLNTWQLGYSLSPSALGKLNNHVSSLRVFVGGHNNIYLTRWSTLDPINDNFPLQRSFTMGLNVRF